MLWLLIPIGTFPLDQTVMAQAKCWRIENYSGWFRILYKSLCCNAVLTFILLHRQARDVCLRLEKPDAVGGWLGGCDGWHHETSDNRNILQVSQKHQAKCTE